MGRFQLLQQIRTHAAATGDRVAYVETSTGRSLSYAQLDRRVERLSNWLQSQLSPGEVVMLRCGNRIEYAAWFPAILNSGAHVLPVSTELALPELLALASRARVRAVVADEPTRAVLKDNVEMAWPLDLEPPSVSRNDDERPAGDLLLASSGTTGEPKIVRRSAYSLEAVSRNMVEAIGFTSADHVLACVPLSHSYGLEHGLLAPLWAGATVHLCDGLDLPLVTTALAGPITVWPAVPSMIELLTAVADDALRMPSLRVAYSAGGPLPRSVYDRYLSRFGVRVAQLYGMTEIGSVTFTPPNDRAFNPASVGRPMRGVSVRVLDADSATGDLPPGREGEIAVRAPSMFSGYLASDAELVDGYFRTGDLGHVDGSGNLVITGRVRLLIDTGGVKVNPLEVEAVLRAHPQVSDCAIVPVRQSETVQRLKAFVVPRDLAAPPDIIDLRRFAKERLAGYKVPRLFEITASLPRTAAGKVKRQLLEAM